jgi:hypothetical protein
VGGVKPGAEARGRGTRDEWCAHAERRMIELVRSEDPVFVSWLEVRSRELGINIHVLDVYTASAYGGAVGAIQRRVMVDDTDLTRARRLLAEVAGSVHGPGHADD